MSFLLDSHDLSFPSPYDADEYGIVAVGGDFSPARLLSAYRSGIFPWPHEDLPLLWFCPNPRFILELDDFVMHKSLVKELKKTSLTIKADVNFLSVIEGCKNASRRGDNRTWINDDLIAGYHELFQQGYAHSIEAYDQDDVLVGGLYGLALGTAFFGESMFHSRSNASKICLALLIAHLREWNFSFVDCQAQSPQFEDLGAKAISLDTFLYKLEQALKQANKMGPWHLHMKPKDLAL